jgi:phosphopantothenoylcysteine decarboxylase/phosphopantothenate--cysteine ligase
MEQISLLQNKRILLGVSGGIAAYKICTLASHLTQAGAVVDVVLTKAAARFVAPLTFEALTGRPAYTDLWAAPREGLPTHIAHIGLAHAADLVVIAPATANTLAKVAHGIADNLLTTLILAASCPVLAAPAMDAGMWTNPATQSNVSLLLERSVHIAGPARGRMASGLEGDGRMLEADEIMGHIRRVIGLNGPLARKRVTVTAGPTREALDPVRFLSNRSSGRQGIALAQASVDRGATVMLITGPVDLPTPIGAHRIDVTSAEEMLGAVMDQLEDTDVLLMAAAVSDYAPVDPKSQKMKKQDKDITLSLSRTQDILAVVAEKRALGSGPEVVVGFAAESQDLVDNAQGKLKEKALDIVVANDITATDAGFEVPTNRVVILGSDDGPEELPLLPKTAVADTVLDRVTSFFAEE